MNHSAHRELIHIVAHKRLVINGLVHRAVSLCDTNKHSVKLDHGSEIFLHSGYIKRDIHEVIRRCLSLHRTNMNNVTNTSTLNRLEPWYF